MMRKQAGTSPSWLHRVIHHQIGIKECSASVLLGPHKVDLTIIVCTSVIIHDVNGNAVQVR